MVQFSIPSQLQTAFDAHLAEARIRNTRQLGVLGGILYATLAVLDPWMIPTSAHSIWVIRAVAVAASIGVYGFTWLPSFQKRYSLLMTAHFLLLGSGVEAMIYLAGPEDMARHSYYAGMILIVMALYTFTFLPILQQAAIGFLLVLAYLLVAVMVQHMHLANEWPLLATAIYLFTGANLIGVFASLQRDRYIRESFLLRHNLITDLERTEAEKRQSEYWSEHDPLTGLANRKHLMRWLEENIRTFDSGTGVTKSGKALALLFIDLDGFKDINDTMGHAAGDEVLKSIAGRLNASVRESDFVARLGGDEFVVVLSLGHDAHAVATRVAGAILAAIETPIHNLAPHRRLSGSIGIAFFPEHASDADTLLQIADAKMYAAKRMGKGKISLE